MASFGDISPRALLTTIKSVFRTPKNDLKNTTCEL
jgi:hypothetical protein